jgi:hypothetical protein
MWKIFIVSGKIRCSYQKYISLYIEEKKTPHVSGVEGGRR